jgi:hypothetical protein
MLAFSLHKFYISTIRVEYKPTNKTLQITMRIFIDDLQKTINKNFDKDYELALPNETKEVDSYIQQYITKMFSVKINDKNVTYHYLGKEYESDMAFIYIEVENVTSIQSIEIRDEMLFDVFPDQKNIIKLFINDTKKTFLLTPDKKFDQLKI